MHACKTQNKYKSYYAIIFAKQLEAERKDDVVGNYFHDRLFPVARSVRSLMLYQFQRS